MSLTGHPIEDAPEIAQFFETAWQNYEQRHHYQGFQGLAETILGRSEFWGCNLNEIPELADTVAALIHQILSSSMRDTIASLLEQPT